MSLLSRFGDRCNPILVREVRQAMRSRGFTGSFVALLTLVSVLTCVMLAVHLEPIGFEPTAWTPGPFGGILFLAVFGCLVLALIGIVPLGAFMAMSEEWNANTWEQLSLSGLTPGRIVRGRLLAAGVQAMLFASALVPFLATCFLMHGLDLAVVGIALGWLAVWSPCYILLAIALGAFSGSRQVRMLLMALLVAVIFAGAIAMGAFMEELVDRASFISSNDFKWGLISFAVIGFLVAIYASSAAVALLTHPLENRSTLLRLVTLVVMILGVCVCAWMYLDKPDSSGPYFVVIAGAFAFWIPAALFSTEPEHLSRRVAGLVSGNRIVALLSAPFLPGGGRGFLFLLVVLPAFLLACASIYYYLPARSTALPRIGYGCLLAAFLSIVTFTGFPAALFSTFPRKKMTRVIAFASIVFVATMGTFFHLSFYSYYRTGHPPWTLINPFALSGIYWSTTWDGREGLRGLFLLMIGLAGIAIALNVPRMVRGVREVLAASAAVRRS